MAVLEEIPAAPKMPIRNLVILCVFIVVVFLSISNQCSLLVLGLVSEPSPASQKRCVSVLRCMGVLISGLEVVHGGNAKGASSIVNLLV